MACGQVFRGAIVSPILQNLSAFAIGLTSGLLVAAGGAWKDTRWESFNWRTFLRSPIVAGSWSLIIHHFAPNAGWFLLSLSCIGAERLTVETWKALWRKMPSKFKQPGRDRGWIIERLTSRRR